MSVLSKYGEVVFSGGYKHDLMWGPDIDITVLTNKPEEAASNALKDFIEQRNFRKYQLGDFVKFPFSDRPQGMIVVLIHEFQGRRWEIEIWFQKSLSQDDDHLNKLLATASDEQKKAILELKYQREKRGISKQSLDSAAIYRDVLSGGKANMKFPISITTVKAAHSIIWVVMAAAVFYILYSGVTGVINEITYASLGLIIIEMIVLGLNKGACPLTNVAKNVKPDWKDGDDIFLPTWLAVHNKAVFGTLFAIGVALVIYRLIVQS